MDFSSFSCAHPIRRIDASVTDIRLNAVLSKRSRAAGTYLAVLRATVFYIVAHRTRQYVVVRTQIHCLCVLLARIIRSTFFALASKVCTEKPDVSTLSWIVSISSPRFVWRRLPQLPQSSYSFTSIPSSPWKTRTRTSYAFIIIARTTSSHFLSHCFVEDIF